jgi:hypothetical protein
MQEKHSVSVAGGQFPIVSKIMLFCHLITTTEYRPVTGFKILHTTIYGKMPSIIGQ